MYDQGRADGDRSAQRKDVTRMMLLTAARAKKGASAKRLKQYWSGYLDALALEAHPDTLDELINVEI